MSNNKKGLGEVFGGRNFASGLLVAIIIATVVFVNIIAYTLTSFFGLYIHSQNEEDFSISDASEKLFRDAVEAGKSVNVIFCMDRKELENHATGSFVHKTALEFNDKYGDFINLVYVNVYTKLFSESEYDDYEVGGTFEAEEYKNYKETENGREFAESTAILPSSVIFEYVKKDEFGNEIKNYRVLTDAYTSSGFGDFYTLDSNLYMTSYNGEEVFSSMVAWVLRDEHPTAYMTIGHGEIADLSLASALSCAGYHISYVDLKRESVPDDAGLVVISNPQNDFERSTNQNKATEISRLEAYRDRGGKILVTHDPYAKSLPVLEAFISGYGIEVAKTEAAENGQETVHIVKDSKEGIELDGFTLVAEHSDDETAKKMLSKTEEYGGRVILRDVAALKLSKEAKPLLVASSSAVCEAGGKTVDDEGGYALIAYSSHKTDSGKESLICFIPTVYLTASDAMITNGYANKNFLYSIFGELYGMGNMPYGAKSITFNDLVLENLTMGSARLYTALFMSVPVLVMIAGAVIMIRRKNR